MVMEMSSAGYYGVNHAENVLNAAKEDKIFI